MNLEYKKYRQFFGNSWQYRTPSYPCYLTIDPIQHLPPTIGANILRKLSFEQRVRFYTALLCPLPLAGLV
ncbi:unnamed protein product [Thelazia callipaeda]|uniref:NADH dehydrogenase [ubiquinone] 1 beta subcomplex subunit 4 n=1 Tax=Thelazia callipaeda TaxID=103827 RepID=A0A0N5D1R8_THECL|nr:unnamed protein product [Thelazia callipaeda]